MEFVDRHGTKLAAGDHIRIKECIGRYGQTAIVSGVIKEFQQYGNLILILDHPISRTGYQHIVRYYQAGDRYLVGVPYGGYFKNNDFEHAHEQWVEKLG